MTTHWRTIWTGTGWGLVATVIVLSLIPSPPKADLPLWDTLNPLAAYALLVFWFAKLTPRWLRLAAGRLSLGGRRELIQGLSGDRRASLPDMAANTLGVLLGARPADHLPRPPTWLETPRT